MAPSRGMVMLPCAGMLGYAQGGITASHCDPPTIIRRAPGCARYALRAVVARISRATDDGCAFHLSCRKCAVVGTSNGVALDSVGVAEAPVQCKMALHMRIKRETEDWRHDETH
eukprot:scaffold318459_cov31-Tisochrysis_lutea.AAC.1